MHLCDERPTPRLAVHRFREPREPFGLLSVEERPQDGEVNHTFLAEFVGRYRKFIARDEVHDRTRRHPELGRRVRDRNPSDFAHEVVVPAP
jgi:hypothetical protein